MPKTTHHKPANKPSTSTSEGPEATGKAPQTLADEPSVSACPPGTADRADREPTPPDVLTDEPSVLPIVGKQKRSRRAKKGWNIQPYGEGRWLACVSDPHSPARKTKVFDQKSQAETWAENYRAGLQLRQLEPRVTPFERIASDYLVDLRRRSRSPLHYDTVKAIIDTAKAKGITDLAGDNVVGRINAILSELKTRSGKPASTKTRNNFLSRMRGVANYAVAHGLLNVNPLIRIKYQRLVQKAKAVFNLDEIGKLVDPKHAAHPFYRAFCCMIYTGFRQREVRFLDWSWFLWDDGQVQMVLDARATATLTEDEGRDVFIPKNGIARSTRLMEELAQTMKPEGDAIGPVFPELRTIDTSAFSRRFEAYVQHCGVTIGDRTPHSTRHTWTCLMLASGENQILVMHYAGHSQADMTAHYARQQESFRARVTRAAWPRGELRLRDFSPGGACYREPAAAPVIPMPARVAP